MQIGPYQLPNNLLLAPMAGITDKPFRDLCAQFGAGLTVSEMVHSNPSLQNHTRTLKKTDQVLGGLQSIQILGADPVQMADAARINQDRGARIIDINMGCPAKKVCSGRAGSALLRNEALVAKILEAVVDAVDIPVTLKIRTGWDLESRNAVNIAKIAEIAGIKALTVHGRSRACKFHGPVEYDTIRLVKKAVKIPIIANGDIASAEKAREVLEFTAADAVMIGRGALGKPWIFQEILSKLNNFDFLPPSLSLIKTIINQHLENLYCFYGNDKGVKIARKHIGWYLDILGMPSVSLRSDIYAARRPSQQLALVNTKFNFITPRVI